MGPQDTGEPFRPGRRCECPQEQEWTPFSPLCLDANGSSQWGDVIPGFPGPTVAEANRGTFPKTQPGPLWAVGLMKPHPTQPPPRPPLSPLSFRLAGPWVPVSLGCMAVTVIAQGYSAGPAVFQLENPTSKVLGRLGGVWGRTPRAADPVGLGGPWECAFLNRCPRDVTAPGPETTTLRTTVLLGSEQGGCLRWQSLVGPP